jgi:hypothetical protein
VRLPDSLGRLSGMYLPNQSGRARRAALIAAVSFVLAGVAAPAAAARPGGTIRTGPNGVTALGSWHVATHPTFPAAVRALGAANAVHAHSSGNSCTGTGVWSGLGLRVLFTSFGGDPYCQGALAQTGTISGAAGRQHWQTARGLRVGDGVSKLKRLYPQAVHAPGGWAIVYSLHSVIAEGSRLDIVTAQIKHHHVSAFRLWIGGAGD